MTPFITICIPAYNAVRYLPETLASVRAQTYVDWELVVTEDGSSESVESLVHDFALTVSQKVTYQSHRENRGLPATRNTGIAAAAGAWIALLDGDDLWSPDHLDDLVPCARRHPAANLVHSGSMLFDSETGNDIDVRAPSEADVYDFPRSLYLGSYAVQPSSVLLNRKLWAKVRGFDPAYRYVEDREMWLRCARAGAVFAYSGRVTCRYRKHAAALTAHSGPMALASARVLQQHLDWNVVDIGRRRRLTAEAWVSAGRIALRAESRIARECFAHAWRILPSSRIAAYWFAAFVRGLKSAKPASP